MVAATWSVGGRIVFENPSSSIRAELTGEEGVLRYSLFFREKPVIDNGRLGILVDRQDLSRSSVLKEGITCDPVELHPPVYGNLKGNRKNVRFVRIPLKSAEQGSVWFLELALHRDGFAFRYLIPGQGTRTITGERSSFVLPSASDIWYFERNSAWKLKNYAGLWLKAPLSEMPTISKMGPVQGAPLVIEPPQGGYILLTEAACWNYAGMRYRATGKNSFAADLADRSFTVRDKVLTPWRVILCAKDLDGLVNAEIIRDLSPLPDSKLYADRSYIRPGRSVWRWWSSGTGTPGQELAYVDWAARLGYEYSTVDDGWKKWPDAWEKVSGLCRAARERGVRIFLWKNSGELDNPADNWAEMRRFLDQVKASGAAGVKIDFMDNEKKKTIDFEIAALKLAAERKLMINFHGCHKPTGESWTYPNEITREAIRGLELNKISRRTILPPTHNAALPFTRFAIGHADYTPFTITPERIGNTTVSHQAATLVSFTSPLLMLAENPAKLFTPEMKPLTSVIREIPSTWDKTRILSGSEIGVLSLMARSNREKGVCFIAAMNGDREREVNVNFKELSGMVKGSFCPATLITDTPASGPGFSVEHRTITLEDSLKLKVRPGGGFVIFLQEKRR